MSDTPEDPHYPPQHSQQLRSEAESLRKAGTAPSSHGHTLSTDALAVLYRMSEASETATDTLKILHELQTHQIELDLMQEQSEANERELTVELERYRCAFECAPVGYFLVGRDGRVAECNAVGASLLRTSALEIEGAALERYLSPASRLALSWRLQKLGTGSTGETCIVHTIDSAPRTLRVFASLAPDKASALLVLTPVEAITE